MVKYFICARERAYEDNIMILASIFNTDFIQVLERCKVAIAGFGIMDAIEVLIIAAMLFLLFTLFRGKKAGALVMGIAIIVLLLLFSNLFGFKVLYYLLSAVLGSGILAIIVIFQPEIREALERLGKGSIKGLMSFSDRRKKKEQYMQVVDNICSAVTEMSKEYTGALIVIERDIELSDIVHTGVRIDANVNDLLIRNLFYNKSPLHDGALVVSGDKIVAAACFLPLTEKEDLDTSLGTRHRAAIGIAERSDAVIVVVSEETGNISIAYDFSLERTPRSGGSGQL